MKLDVFTSKTHKLQGFLLSHKNSLIYTGECQRKSELGVRLAGHGTGNGPPVEFFLLTVPGRGLFVGSFVLYLSCVCHASPSVHCCHVVT